MQLIARSHAERLGAGFSAMLAALLLAGDQNLAARQRPQAAALPPALKAYLATAINPSEAEQKRLLQGEPVTKLLDANESNEVAVFGAIWIGAPIRRYTEAVQDIENFERGPGFRVTRRISAPPRIEDFAEMHLSKQDVGDLRRCRVGKCEVKLGERAVLRFRTEIDWKRKDVQQSADALMRRIALEYVNGYLEGGNDRLAVYRDESRPRFVANEFRAMVGEMPELTASMPALRHYLLDFPRAMLPGSTSFLYWQETEFGLKPTLRISHVTVRENEESAVVASKMLYASHYFWTGLELRVLLSDATRGTGFWFVTISRSRTDGLSGFTGAFVRRRVRSEAQKGTLAVLRGTKTRLEQPK